MDIDEIEIWQALDLYPLADFRDRRSRQPYNRMTASVALYVPWNWGLDQQGVESAFPPGVMCAHTELGAAMVQLEEAWFSQWAATDTRPLANLWSVHLVPRMNESDFGHHYRPAKWKSLKSREHAEAAGYVKFLPRLLQFDAAVQGLGLPAGRDDGGPYDDGWWVEMYARYGLTAGRVYEIEYVYSLPYIKVKGVAPVMCAEVWSPMIVKGPSQEALDRVKKVLKREDDATITPFKQWAAEDD